MDKIKGKIEEFNNDLLKIPFAQQLTQATQVPLAVFALGIVTISVLLVAFNFSISAIIV